MEQAAQGAIRGERCNRLGKGLFNRCSGRSIGRSTTQFQRQKPAVHSGRQLRQQSGWDLERRARHEQQRARTLGHQPGHQLLAERPQTPRDQVGGIGAQTQRRRLQPTADHQLAHMAGLGHQPEGLAGLLLREHLQRDRAVVPLLQIHQQGGQQITDAPGLGGGHLQQIERQIAGIGPALGGLLAAPDLELAQLHETSTRRQSPETGIHPLAFEAVEHHIDTTAAGGRKQLLGEGSAAGIEHRLHPLLQQRRLLGLAGGGEDAGPQAPGHLQRGLADTAGGRMDQHRLARLQLGQIDEAVDRREEGGAQGGPQLGAELRRQGQAELGATAHVAGEAAHRQGRQHPLTDAIRRHPGTHGHHPADALATEGQLAAIAQAQLGAVGLKQAEGIEHIAEVEARGLHRDLQFAGGGRLRRGWPGRKRIQAAGCAARPAVTLLLQRHDAQAARGAVAPGQARLTAGSGPELGPIGRAGGRRSAAAQIQQGPVQLWLLQGGRAPPAPQGPGQLLLRLRGIQHQPELSTSRLRRDRLRQVQQGAAQTFGRGGRIRQIGPEQHHIGRPQSRSAGEICSGSDSSTLKRDAVLGEPALQRSTGTRVAEQQRAAGQRPAFRQGAGRQRQPAALIQEIGGPGRGLIRGRQREHPLQGLPRQAPQPEALDPAQQLTVPVQHQVGLHEGRRL